MKTFDTLAKGDRILMEGAKFRVECFETVNDITYLSKIVTKDTIVEVLDNSPFPNI